MRLGQWKPDNPTRHPDSLTGESTDQDALRSVTFDQFFDRYCDRVLKYCFYQLGCWEDAEDTAQHIFEKAFTAWDRFVQQKSDVNSGMRSWLFSIAHNEIANRHRTRARNPADPLSWAEAFPDNRPSPEELAILADHQGQLQAAMSRLSSDMKRVIELRLFGFDDAEIAKLLDKTPGAVRTAQCRAVIQIRSLMGVGHHGEGGTRCLTSDLPMPKRRWIVFGINLPALPMPHRCRDRTRKSQPQFVSSSPSMPRPYRSRLASGSDAVGRISNDQIDLWN